MKICKTVVVAELNAEVNSSYQVLRIHIAFIVMLWTFKQNW